MLSKADGSLEHRGNTSVVSKPAAAPRAASAPRPAAVANAPAAASPAAAPTVPVTGGVDAGLRSALAACLDETSAAVRGGASIEELRQQMAKVAKLVDVLADFG